MQIVTVILASSLLAVACTQAPPPVAPAPAPAAISKDTGMTFTGKITQISFGCAVDGSCDLTVDGTKHVHFGHDTRGQPPTEWGRADDLWTLMNAPDQGVGRTIEVSAATTDEVNYTIEGKKTYYIKVLP